MHIEIDTDMHTYSVESHGIITESTGMVAEHFMFTAETLLTCAGPHLSSTESFLIYGKTYMEHHGTSSVVFKASLDDSRNELRFFKNFETLT